LRLVAVASHHPTIEGFDEGFIRFDGFAAFCSNSESKLLKWSRIGRLTKVDWKDKTKALSFSKVLNRISTVDE
jgi:hypothetical protein